MLDTYDTEVLGIFGVREALATASILLNLLTDTPPCTCWKPLLFTYYLKGMLAIYPLPQVFSVYRVCILIHAGKWRFLSAVLAISRLCGMTGTAVQ